jgi:hypothetical protein
MSSSPNPSPNRATARPVALVITVAVMALTLGAGILQMQPRPPQGADAPPDVFSARRAFAALQYVLADGTPHPLGSAEQARVRQRLIAQLEALGYPVSVQETVSCYSAGAYAACAPVYNILAQLPGQTSGPAVLLMAHYDAAPLSPGAADDGAGVSGLLEIARAMKAHGPYRNLVLFLFTDGEERGLLGAQAFMEQHPLAGQIGVVINQEARGSCGESMMFETSPDNAWLIEAYATSVPHPVANSLSYEVYRNMPNDTDLTVFKEAGLPGMNFSFIACSETYHTPLDSLQNLNLGSVQHQGESVLALAGALAEHDLSNPPAGDASYVDIFSLLLLRWPAGWTLPLTVAALVLLAATAVVLLLRRQLTPGALGWGLLTGLLTLVGSILLGVGLTVAVGAIAGTSNFWYAYPLPTRLVLWAGVFLVTGLAALLLGRRAGPWGLGLAAWFYWALLSLALALTLPGATIMLLVPTLWSALLLAIVGCTPLARLPLAREIAQGAGVFGAALFALPLALNLETAMGMAISPLVTLPVALAALTLLPFLALPPGRARLRTAFILAAAAVLVAGFVSALLVPAYTPAAPQIVNLYNVQDRDAGTARWSAVALGSTLPAGLRQQFDAEPQAILPWTQQLFPIAPADLTTTPAPGLEVLSDERSGGGRIVRARLHGAHGDSELDLLLPITTTESVTVGEQTLTVNPDADGNGFFNLWCYACDGQEVILRFRDAGPAQVLMAEYAGGLPAGGERFVQARPDSAIAAYSGDLTIVIKRAQLP